MKIAASLRIAASRELQREDEDVPGTVRAAWHHRHAAATLGPFPRRPAESPGLTLILPNPFPKVVAQR